MLRFLSKHILIATLFLGTTLWAVPGPVTSPLVSRSEDTVRLSWTNPVAASLNSVQIFHLGESAPFATEFISDSVANSVSSYDFTDSSLLRDDGGSTQNFEIVVYDVNAVKSSTVNFSTNYQSIRPDAPALTDSGDYLTSTTNLQATWTVTIDDNDFSEVRLGASLDSSAITTNWSYTSTNITEHGVTLSGLSLTHASEYFVLGQYLHDSGLWSLTGASDGVTVDITVPVVSGVEVVPTGPYSSQHVVTNTFGAINRSPRLTFSWTESDSESGVVSRDYQVKDVLDDQIVVDFVAITSNAGTVTINTFSFQDGVSYSVGVRAKNGAGGYSSVIFSDPVTYDLSPPIAAFSVPNYSTANNSLTVGWSISDPHSDVVSASYRILRNDTNIALIDWTSTTNYILSNHEFMSLSLQNGVTYSVEIKADNGAGVTSSILSSSPIMVDFTAPTLSAIVDEGTYKHSITDLQFTFSTSDPETGVSTINYFLKQVSGDVVVVPLTTTTSMTTINLTNLNLDNGVTYSLSVQAINQAGLLSTELFSDGIKIDVTTPSILSLTDDGDYVEAVSSLNIDWVESELESEIVSRSYRVQEVGSGNIREWTSTTATSSLEITGLPLVSGESYRVALKVENSVGLVSTVITSDGIIVDQSAPPTPSVSDDGMYTQVSDQFIFSWTESDLESGITTMSYRLDTTQDNIQVVDWTTVPASSNFTISNLSLLDGVTYSVSVRLINGAGIESGVGQSDGIFIESTPPTISMLVDDGLYVSQNHTLTIDITASDNDSGIDQLRYTVLEHDGNGNSVDIVGITPTAFVQQLVLSDLSLNQNTFYTVGIQVRNGAGFYSDMIYTDGVTVDITAPSLTSVVDQGNYTATDNSLTVTVNYSEQESGIAQMEYFVYETATSNSPIVAQNSVPSAHVTFLGLNLQNDERYFVGIRLTNGAGATTNIVYSDGITINTTIPVIPTVFIHDDATSDTNRLRVSWVPDSDDVLSVARYAIVRSTTESINESQWTVTTNTFVSNTVIDVSPLDHGEQYFLAVQLANLASIYSSTGYSDEVTVDTTGPSSPVLTVRPQVILANSQITLEWSSLDPESGIAMAEYAIASDRISLAPDIQGWAQIPNAATTYVTSPPSVPYENGESYTFLLRVTNGAGAIATNNSDAIVADLIAPKIFNLRLNDESVSLNFISELYPPTFSRFMDYTFTVTDNHLSTINVELRDENNLVVDQAPDFYGAITLANIQGRFPSNKSITITGNATYYLYITAYDLPGNVVSTRSVNIRFTESAYLGQDLVRVYPNPFNPNHIDHDAIRIALNYPDLEEVALYVYSLSGQLVYQYFNDTSPDDEIEWDGFSLDGDILANGVYVGYLRVKSSSGDVETKVLKIAVLK